MIKTQVEHIIDRKQYTLQFAFNIIVEGIAPE
jgi:hypothetical protein